MNPETMNIVIPNKTVVRQSKSRMVKWKGLATGGEPAGGREVTANSPTGSSTPMMKAVAPRKNTIIGEPLSMKPQSGRSGSAMRIAKVQRLAVNHFIFELPRGR